MASTYIHRRLYFDLILVQSKKYNLLYVRSVNKRSFENTKNIFKIRKKGFEAENVE